MEKPEMAVRLFFPFFLFPFAFLLHGGADA